MSGPLLYGLAAAALIGLGLHGVLAHAAPLRRVLAFNLVGAGVFLLFGVGARRGAAAGLPGDPVPQALVITGIVVAFAATALAVALIRRLAILRAAAAGTPQEGTAPTAAPPRETR
ncbi:NADH-quinone oxidoreductase subunit K [Ancylobacter mangrovi]|uniref:NADH-quinone oxidoreductase subunit K n=1 Tax=Ancylobacter mangrovi TaxID=2972472 RepID=UPI002162F54D|nr:NADH-quinone oxidoreductase subunit K [Ancylobacter mangrovi]MCS0503206.1 NADH-quinone oxidoreductase subunit K [Ancylobacter mangrovi]